MVKGLLFPLHWSLQYPGLVEWEAGSLLWPCKVYHDDITPLPSSLSGLLGTEAAGPSAQTVEEGHRWPRGKHPI